MSNGRKNVDVIFSEDNLNKMQAAFGTSYKVAVENALNRMRTGRNAQYTADSNTARFMDWVNGSIGAIMFSMISLLFYSFYLQLTL